MIPSRRDFTFLLGNSFGAIGAFELSCDGVDGSSRQLLQCASA